jgi:hypothetical protein
MSDNKILQAIDYLETQKRLFPKSFNVLSGHFDIAISALKEQAEREKGCEYCNGNALKGVALTYFWGIPKVALHSGEELTESEKFKFCPNCGRDLRKPVEK